MYPVKNKMVWNGTSFEEVKPANPTEQAFVSFAVEYGGGISSRFDGGGPFFREVAAGDIRPEHKALFEKLKSDDLENVPGVYSQLGGRRNHQKDSTIDVYKF